MERVTKEQLAEMLNNAKYGEEVNSEVEALAKDNGLVICFGYSDDNLELRGAIDDEIGACDGGEAHIYIDDKNNPRVVSESDGEYQQLLEALVEFGLQFGIFKNRIVAEWCPKDLDVSWKITSTLPYASFNVYEDGDLFCVGCVIDVNDIK